jgi:phage N-6-adenine-methyltransferase
MNSVHFSSSTDEYETPQQTFDVLNQEFGFTLDVCATHENAKCKKHFTKEDNGLIQDWRLEVCWMNPPYSQIKHWIKKAYEASLEGAIVVCLIPSRTDTIYWHEYVMKSKDIRFIKGRLKFGGMSNSAPFPSAIVVFCP